MKKQPSRRRLKAQLRIGRRVAEFMLVQRRLGKFSRALGVTIDGNAMVRRR